MNYPRMRRYPVDSIVMGTSGDERIKKKDGVWQSMPRYVAEMSDKVIGGGHELSPNEKVFHLDCTTKGERGHNRPENLVVVKHNIERIKFVKSRVIFVPSMAKRNKGVFAAV